MEKDFDLVIIGAGPGGYTAAFAAAGHGMKTALIEKDRVGGTCLIRGCIPTKTILHTAEQLRGLRDASARGLITGADGAVCDWKALYAEKSAITDNLSDGLLKALKAAKVEVIFGNAKVIGAHAVEVESEGATGAHAVKVESDRTAGAHTLDVETKNAPGVRAAAAEMGTENARILTAENILIAAGSHPVRIPVKGADLPGVLTSDEFLDNPPESMKSLVIIGGGVIGTEFAEAYSALGVDVTIIEMMPSVLAVLDSDLSKNAALILKKRGVKIVTGAALSAIEKAPGDAGGLTCFYAKKGRKPAAEGASEETALESVTGDVVLLSTGRRSSTDGLFADGIVPAMNRGITVNEHFETSIPGIYAIGDVTGPGAPGGVKLAHTAAAQGRAVALSLAGETGAPVDFSAVPSCVYMKPEIASTGLTLDEAKARGIPAAAARGVMHGNARTVIAHTERSFVKLVYNTETQKLIGAQLMCENASDIISEYTEAIVKGLTLKDLCAVIRPHPTFEEAGTDAIFAALSKL